MSVTLFTQTTLWNLNVNPKPRHQNYVKTECSRPKCERNLQARIIKSRKILWGFAHDHKNMNGKCGENLISRNLKLEFYYTWIILLHGEIILLTYLLHGAESFLRTLRHGVSKLTGLQLVKKLSAFHRTWRFISALTSVHHLSLSWASPIQSIYPHPTSWRSILILSTHLCLGLPNGLPPSGFPTKTLYTPLSSPHPYPPHSQPISFFLILSPAQYWVRSTNHLLRWSNISVVKQQTS